MIINVGSTNKTKINAVRNVVKLFFDEVIINGVSVNSGVSDMPLSDDETINGAVNRAINAKENADIGVGIEGGISEVNNELFLCAWVAVTNGKKTGIACTTRIKLPSMIANELRNGRELGPLMDELTNLRDVKHNSGTIGLLTNNLISRTKSFEDAIICAFSQLTNKWYE